jgi:2-polyprenyl-6-methoxyphenol hydroxylase-like FAD-dependent oxidoreductase
MTMAIELKRAGMNVRIIDKSNHLAKHSQALVVQARTLEQFQRYGIASQAVDSGRQLTKASFWSDGKNILTFEFRRIPSRYPYLLFLPQSKTEAILNAHMESLGLKTERETELVSFEQRDDGADCVLRRADGSQERVSPRWIVGCDGAHSAVRKFCGIPFEGKGVGLSFFLGDLELDGPDAPADELVLHLHRGDVVFMGRLTDKLTRLIVALHSEQKDAKDRELTIQDFQNAIDKANVRVKIRSAEWMTPFHVNDLQAQHYRAGRVFLAGDAAHIHSPVGGQGMNTGIQDAANLAWKLAAVIRGADEKILDSYEEERGAVGRNLLKFTERGLKLATASNPVIEYVRDALAPLVSKPRAMQDTFVGFISETAIEYRRSSAVADHGGDGALEAGDRLPDLDILRHGQPSTLLHNWTQAKHLAISLNATEAERREISSLLNFTQVMSLQESELDDEGRRALGIKKKLLIVRPDGYVGFRGRLDQVAELSSFAKQDGLK